MLDQVLGMDVIAIDAHGRPVVRDKAKRSYRVLEDGRFVPLHPTTSRPAKSKWDDLWFNPIGQAEKKP